MSTDDWPRRPTSAPGRELPRASRRQHPRRQPGQLARPDRARGDRRLLLLQGRQLPQPRQLHQHPHPDGRDDLLAYGVVFVLLIGEIDLSISYISGIAGVVVAKLTLPDGSRGAGLDRDPARDRASCALIGAFQGSFVAFIGVPAFVVTLAGYQIWQGVIQKSIEAEGVIVIQDTTSTTPPTTSSPSGRAGSSRRSCARRVCSQCAVRRDLEQAARRAGARPVPARRQGSGRRRGHDRDGDRSATATGASPSCSS